ncbi:hypothetical protein KIH27_20115 [Mycobacterium sp. M1]|uniref:Uncharacterized protein n=1 Tax=Mycolicibacter acidiphilus TaxID=2835306 RepID=A0ABS5RNK4_9MYCO|nr:hypothetical protein [Mycolicibacter acidiphilus]MBS9535893.1 hypothetical protein [Mycolicibacter acidiphilus]
MAITYAHNGIWLGIGAALFAGMATENVAVAVIAGVAGAVAGVYAIRAIERLIDRGVEAGFTAVSGIVQRRTSPPGAPPQSGLPYAQPGQHHEWGPYPPVQQWPSSESGSPS